MPSSFPRYEVWCYVVPDGQVYLICFSWVLIGCTQRSVRYVYTRWLAKPVHDLIHHENNSEETHVPQQPAEKLPDTPVGDSMEQRTSEEVEQP